MSDSYEYQGQADSGSLSSGYNSQTFLIDRMLNARHTAMPVKVMRAPYDSNGNAIPPGTVGPTGFIDVLPMVNQLDGNGNATPHGTVYGVPYARLNGGNTALIVDPAVGDIGIMTIAESDISSVKATKAPANPGSRRRNDFADGLYIGSILTGTPTQYVAATASGLVIADKNGNTVTMGSGGMTLVPAGGGTVKIGTGAHFVLIDGGSGVSTNLKADG